MLNISREHFVGVDNKSIPYRRSGGTVVFAHTVAEEETKQRIQVYFLIGAIKRLDSTPFFSTFSRDPQRAFGHPSVWSTLCLRGGPLCNTSYIR